MQGWLKALAALALAAGGAAPAGAQVVGGNPTAHVLLFTQFRSALSYEAALQQLDGYYQEQVGRKLAVAFPALAPRQHYDVWHDMWVAFEPAGEGTLVTMKRPADSITSRLVKNWMLGYAGRLGAELPITYKDLPAMSAAEADIYATPKDIVSILKADASLKPLPTWQHLGLIVSLSPMASVIMDPAGLHGIHHMTVTAETAAAAKQLLARVMLGAQKPCICAAYSETAELDAEIAKEAQERSDTLGAHTSASIYTPTLGLKNQEQKIRSDPEMAKRIAQAAGYYDIKFRIDKPYRQVTVTWSELQEYSREDGKFKNERVAGRSIIATPRMPPTSGSQLNARTKLEPLKPGAYRIRLEGDMAAAAKPVLIDERIYWFDGKVFEEL